MANNKTTADIASELAEPLAKELGLDIWDVVFEKEGASWYLRVFIEKDGGVSMDDCEAFSRPFNSILDEKDFIEQSYIFEVGSPGIGRILRKPQHFEKYIGYGVRVRLIRPVDGVKEIIGTLEKYNKEDITIDNKVIKFSDISYVKAYDDEDLFSE